MWYFNKKLNIAKLVIKHIWEIFPIYRDFLKIEYKPKRTEPILAPEYEAGD